MNSGMMVHGPSNDHYETPPCLFTALDTEFGFGFDAAAREEAIEVEHNGGPLLLTGSNWLCKQRTSNIEVGIKAIRASGERVWCNPPYSKIDLFVTLALQSPNLWCFLLPSRTGTDWYHRLLWSERVIIRPMRKRIQFLLNGQPPLGKDGKPQGPRFDSLVAIVRPR